MARDTDTVTERPQRGLLILPLTKSPWPEGRIGSPQVQDWYEGVRISQDLLEEAQARGRTARILVLSNFHAKGKLCELACYTQALEELGVPPRDTLVRGQGLETIGQLEIAERIAREEGADLEIVETWTHAPRVRWLTRGKGYRHYVAWGMPRPSDLFSDFGLTFVFPLLDLFGLRRWFQQRIIERRRRGVL